MMDMHDRIQQRIHLLRAKAELLAILEYYMMDQGVDEDYAVMRGKITELLSWLEEESPLS